MRGLLGTSKCERRRLFQRIGDDHFKIDGERPGIKYCDKYNRELYTVRECVRCLKCIGKSVKRIDYKIINREKLYKKNINRWYRRLSIENLNDER